jgi:hypothetical protein
MSADYGPGAVCRHLPDLHFWAHLGKASRDSDFALYLLILWARRLSSKCDSAIVSIHPRSLSGLGDRSEE